MPYLQNAFPTLTRFWWCKLLMFVWIARIFQEALPLLLSHGLSGVSLTIFLHVGTSHYQLIGDIYQNKGSRSDYVSLFAHTDHKLLCKIVIEHQQGLSCSVHHTTDLRAKSCWSISVEPVVQIPELSFSSPVSVSGKLLFGCRNDELYCCDSAQ